MKTVLITGAARGIGAAVAREFAANGWRVIINYKKSDALADKLKKELGAVLYRADVSCAEEVDKMSRYLASVGLFPDCIVNNAGISGEALFCDITEACWDEMFAVNTKSAFLVSKAFLPHMISQKSGSIINISSIWGEIGAACEVHYSASKAAIIGMTKALAKELAPSGIRVNCVCPGFVDTDMTAAYSDEDMEIIKSEIPQNRTAKPCEIAKSVYFLSSDAASYITGQVLGVNGGWRI